MKRKPPAGGPEGAENWTLEEIENYIIEERKKPFHRAQGKITQFVNGCVMDPDFKESPALLMLLLMLRDVLAKEATEEWDLDEYLEPIISEFPSRGGKARHIDNKRDKAFVIQYYEDHKNEFKSTRAAAKAIDEAHLVDIKFRTIYDWLREIE
ncbi:hypothetical protein GCM10007160_16740 [Litchfieldella qijiaojingensis]|uniref:Uncharacterized protein n=1 Tax=Litchfieldella qijiaojingensis TaxID=980347 RepID=A0ABQ2YR17_9GAMM|nr:hypothetical protein [Halomonas qijiaojingensis]GGX89969.1 hypothetical protein GCM10007160_16740 [Halomonas qijiaojingensis]